MNGALLGIFSVVVVHILYQRCFSFRGRLGGVFGDGGVEGWRAKVHRIPLSN